MTQKLSARKESTLQNESEFQENNSEPPSVSERAKQANLNKFETAVSVLEEERVPFTGEQFIPGAGVEICYEHYHRYAFAAQFINQDQVVLDLGCGIGYGSLYLAGKCKHVYSLDRDTSCIAALQSAAAKAEVTNISCIEADAADLADLSELEHGPIDLVVCHEFIEHIPHELQQSIVSTIAAGKAPFQSNTMFLVSTPDREEYAKTRSDHNEYHLDELSLDEFHDLLQAHFEGVSLYWQAPAAANVIHPVHTIKGKTQAAFSSAAEQCSPFYLKWLDRMKLTAAFGDTPPDNGTYLYAICSSTAAPEISQKSVLLDFSDHLMNERMTIAALELQSIESKASQLSRKLDQKEKLKEQFEQKLTEKSAALEAQSKELKLEREAQIGMQDNLKVQGAKISSLLDKIELIGAERTVKEEQLVQLYTALGTDSANAPAAVAELLQWKAIGQQHLAPTPAAAEEQAEVLWSYVTAMGSPGHRLVTYLGKLIGNTWLGRTFKAVLAFIVALRKA